MSLIETMHEKGYVKAWFDWLQWTVVTVAIFLAARSTHSISVAIIGFISFILLLGTGYIGATKLTGDFISKDQDIPKGVSLLIILSCVFIIQGIMIWCVISLFGALISQKI